MGTCCSANLQTVEEAESAQQFRAMDSNRNNLACQKEMAQYVASRAELWAMLSVNLGLSEEECRATATRVAMELASGLEGGDALQTELTQLQFHTFRTKYMLDGKGAQEFFHRCIFATFDKDNNNTLDEEEVDQFLETFYKTGSIFEGDGRLPPKEQLKQRLYDQLDESRRDHNGTACLTFEQIRDIIRGTTTDATRNNTQKTKATSQTANTNANTTTTSSRHSTTSGQSARTSPETAALTPEETPEPATPNKKKKSSDPEQTPETNGTTTGSSKPSPKTANGKPRQRRADKQQSSSSPRATNTNPTPNKTNNTLEQAPTRKQRSQKSTQGSNSSNGEATKKKQTSTNNNTNKRSTANTASAASAAATPSKPKAKRQ